MTKVAGRTAVVTGGGSGIGRGLALELAAKGAAVAIADILPENAEAVAREIAVMDGKALAIGCDVTDMASLEAAKQAATEHLGPVSLLFANAGATSFERITDMSADDIDWIVHANLLGVLNCVKTFYPDMVAARDGHFCATASTAGLLPSWIPYHAAYSGAKMGIIGMMLNLAIEAREHGVGVTAFVPHGVVSNMKANNARYRPARFGGPGEGEVQIPEGAQWHAEVKFRPAELVGKLVVRAVEEDRPMVISDGAIRKTFDETYRRIVYDAFDFADAFYAAEE
ncbi:NADP-dependent 3-hydroxy acid dehydrogenase YdfG [Novosphingobium sp. PhB165]|uniref:SDR family oxidoreductase n=1 Tax=Novosphingobium sp. PhB165 TaxID=2485105 RepID=UPI001049FD5D|nr:SDR family NAD(P)-dependent oxidoreductase [Novosphingobium sp. PhB165]TCM20788.1 NADP-dependent 3-hydroxy acid dehydrogenase YdfG [Novosphingobium sp. PhB165]